MSRKDSEVPYDIGKLLNGCHATVQYITKLLSGTEWYKRRLKRMWQNGKSPVAKTRLNKAIKESKSKLAELKEESIEEFLKNADPNKKDDCSLWRATKYQKTSFKATVKDVNNSWCRFEKRKAGAFGNHVKNTFKPFALNSDHQRPNIQYFRDCPFPVAKAIFYVKLTEVQAEVQWLKNSKSASSDNIDAWTTK